MSEPWRNDDRIANAKARISHIREGDKLVRTLATIEEGDKVHAGVALRHPDDRSFSRKMGRSIAVGRAKFALAKHLGLTGREGKPSRFQLFKTLSKDEFPTFARDVGVNIPEDKPALVDRLT